jgi:hypothetical protein
MQQIIKVYDRIHKSEKWFNFSVNFLMGVIASILGSIIYSSVATRYNLPPRGKFIELLKKMLLIRKRPEA